MISSTRTNSIGIEWARSKAIDAILLVGGEGTRLRPLTVTTPKPMLPVAGRPITEHQIARLAAAGVTRIALATAYKADVFNNYFGDNYDGVQLLYAFEEQALGTAGAIHNAAKLLDGHPDDPILVFNGDILGGHDIEAQIAAHVAMRADVTLHLVQVADPRAFGCVPTDSHGWVTAFLEKTDNPPTNMINAGCYVMRRSIIDHGIPGNSVVSVERDTFPGLLRNGARILGFPDFAYWLDLGKPADFVKGSADLVRRLVFSPIVPTGGDEALLLPGSSVDSTAVVDGGTVLHAGVSVGANCHVAGSIIMEDTRIADRVDVLNCVIGRGVVIESGCRLDHVVVAEGAHIGADNIIPSGTRIWPGKSVSAGVLRTDGTNPSP